MPSFAPLIAMILAAANPIRPAEEQPSGIAPAVSWSPADAPAERSVQPASATSPPGNGLAEADRKGTGTICAEHPPGRFAANGASPQPASDAVPLSAARQETPLPLSAAGHTAQHERHGPSLVTVASSLAIVLGLFFLLAWGMRRVGPRGSTLLPGEVFEVLGHAPLAGRQQVHLLRCGSKLLLVSLTPGGAETLTEVADPGEVGRLTDLCNSDRPRPRSKRREEGHA